MAKVLVALMLAMVCMTLGEAHKSSQYSHGHHSGTGKTYGHSKNNGRSKSSSYGYKRYYGYRKVTGEYPIEAVTKLCKKLDVAQVGGTQQAIVCENFDLVLECPKGTMLNVLRANYGRSSTTVCDPAVLGITSNLDICVTNASTNIVATQCQGQKRCQFTANNALFTDTCPNTYKFLEVDFSCDKENEENEHSHFHTHSYSHSYPVQTYEKKDEEDMVHQAYACEDNVLVLECPRWSAITVTRANFGRSSTTICDPTVLGVTSTPAICLTNSSTDIVGTLCNGREQCQFTVTNALLTDTCPGTFKFLEVDFTCEKKEGGLKDQDETKCNGHHGYGCGPIYSFHGYSYYSFLQWIKVLQKWVMQLHAQ